MSTQHSEPLSRRDYARLHHVSTQSIDKAVARNLIVEEPGGGIMPGQVWELRRKARNAARRVVWEEIRLKATLKRTRARTDMLTRKAAELRASTIPRKQAEKEIRALTADALLKVRALCASKDPTQRAVGRIALTDLGDLQIEALRMMQLLGPPKP